MKVLNAMCSCRGKHLKVDVLQHADVNTITKLTGFTCSQQPVAQLYCANEGYLFLSDFESEGLLFCSHL